jgi:hypothetical protein
MRKPQLNCGLWLLVIIAAVVALTGIYRAAATILYWQILPALDILPGRAYLLMGGLLWMVIGLASVVVLLLRPMNWRIWTGLAAALMVVTYWADRIFFTRSTISWTTLWFSVGMTVLLISVIWIALAGRQAVDIIIKQIGKKNRNRGTQ